MARELILKLGKKITDRVDVKLGMTKLDEDSPEYYGLASVVTDEDGGARARERIVSRPHRPRSARR